MKKQEEFKGWSFAIPKPEDLQKGIVNLHKIIPPEFVERKTIDRDDIEELAENIKRVGLINPLVVKKVKDKFEIIAGHRRYRALKLLGAVSVQCIIRNLEKLEADTVKLSENIYRTDLTDLEEAESIAHLMKVGKKNDKQIAKEIGKSLSYVQQKIAILKYPENIRVALQVGEITFSVSRELVRIKNENLRKEYLRHAIKGGATPAVVKEWVDDIMRAEKAERNNYEEANKNPAVGEIKLPSYFCFACGEEANFNDSTLVRIHSKCQSEIMKGG